MDFVRGCIGGQQFHCDLRRACDDVVEDIRHVIVNRASSTAADESKSGVPASSIATSRKLWEGFAADGSMVTTFDAMAARLEQLFLEHIVGAIQAEPTTGSDASLAAKSGDVQVQTFRTQVSDWQLGRALKTLHAPVADMHA